MTVRFKNYIIVKDLAEGGFGKVQLALEKKQLANRLVVIKTIKPSRLEDKQFDTLFLEEIKAAFPLNHPNLTTIYDYGRHDDMLYCVMEFVDGVSLKELITHMKKRKRKIPVPIISWIIKEAAQGLNYAHHFRDDFNDREMGLVHRDISPQNIMVSFEGQVKVIDFGIAKTEDNEVKTQTGAVKGKPSYMSPEYVNGKKYDHRFDQFALGIVFWELLCGKPLFKAPSVVQTLRNVDKCEVPIPSSFRTSVPKSVDNVVMTMLNEKPKDRFSTLKECVKELDKYCVTQDTADRTGVVKLLEKVYADERRGAGDRLRKKVSGAIIKDVMENMSPEEFDKIINKKKK
ncbi:MAG: serine/threonine protein kinase [Deltaproteobacteria bacterium]|nr:MAG: serine/threonine protein kinase [Deltaproteobacteria bacterium]TNF31489.1 MAG: serine/threonine protein kinase [Deltaproteobacteria bacterium]